MFTLYAKDLENSFEHKLERSYALAEEVIMKSYNRGCNHASISEILLFSETGNQVLYRKFKDALEQHGFTVCAEPAIGFRTGREFRNITIYW